ncbi:MAG: 23S rRNA (adenine(2503)-C(2))-methyltransferase RlmN [bacterium]|nr:23S rRNA (adenine(2503)-C(2))-methyltransferase RlmN [bacterium]
MELTNLDKILVGESKFRKTQVEKAIYHDFTHDWDKVKELPKELRSKLNKHCSLDINATLFSSKDNLTNKALIVLKDNNAVETVLMRHSGGRNTLCVSCMIGCPMNCAFCATGVLGLTRELTTDEIIVQAIYFARLLKKEKQRINSVVFMGMGEPLLNYENVMAAIRLLQSPNGFNIGARHISISTCGILDGIKKISNEDLPLNLAISLHGSNDEVRRSLMPIAKGYTIAKLMQAVDEYIKKTNRKVMFEYLLISGVNDKNEHALELSKLIKNKLTFVNLIRYNPTGKFTPSSTKQMKKFKDILKNNGIPVTTRYRFGLDINGACGQLASIKK